MSRFEEYKKTYRLIAEGDKQAEESRREFVGYLAMLSEEEAARELESIRVTYEESGAANGTLPAALAVFNRLVEQYREARERLQQTDPPEV